MHTMLASRQSLRSIHEWCKLVFVYSCSPHSPKQAVVQESKAKAKEQLCFHHLRGTCTFGDECKFKHDLTDYVRRKPQDLPGECPFSCVGTCPYSLTCRWATKHKNPDELTKKWLMNQDVAKDGAPIES